MLPVLFLIVFGSIQACNVIFLQQFITEIGYQGALYAGRPDATEAEVESDLQAMLSARGVTGAVVEVSGTAGESFDTLTATQVYRVRIQVAPNVLHFGPSITNYSLLTTESFGRRPLFENQ